MMPGVPERRTHDYSRHRTTTLFAVLNTATSKVIGEVHRRHRAKEFLAFLRTLDEATPAKLYAHLVVEHYGPHETPVGQVLDGSPPSLPRALHANVFLVAQSGRTLVCIAQRATNSSRPSGTR
jgi:hypothetical protein